MADLQDSLPPGWECRKDENTGQFYYLNHKEKISTWEDPRKSRISPFSSSHSKVSNVNVEHIPMQYGSADLRRNYVYPSHSSPRRAFQVPRNATPKSYPLQEMRTIRNSPLSVRAAKVQDTSLTITDSDEAVARIGGMFPTATETHIRILLKKYHNREALVISALQVEKHPITTPGPFATPPPQRNIHLTAGVHAPLHMTPPPGLRGISRGGSPVLRPGSTTNSTYTGSPRVGEYYRSSPRPHSSPKLKLRYMKSIFPAAEETAILEILQNNDNNIQKTSDALKELGFIKKDAVKVAQQKLDSKNEAKKIEEDNQKSDAVIIPPPRMKSLEEKQLMKDKLKQKYKDVADQVITFALESVDFDENKANQILQIMVKEEEDKVISVSKIEIVEKDEITELDSPAPASTIPISQSRLSIKSLLKSERNGKEKSTFNRIIDDVNGYKSSHITNTKGHNVQLAKGANENLLLEDYVKWQGTNPNLRKGPQGLAKGPNKSLLSNRMYKACGSNAELRKGPKFGLAKGSIFAQVKELVIGESRGK